jgi:hypothetical protein
VLRKKVEAMATYTAPSIPLTSSRGGRRAEIVFAGVDQAGPSFEGRVFLNNPAADATTARTPDTGYAGAFHVYGYGKAAPPAIAEAMNARGPGGGPVAPIEKRVRADEAAVRAALEGADDLTITVVSIPADPGGPVPERPFEEVSVLFDRASTEP